MAVTSGGMNVCHSTFLLSLGWQKAVCTLAGAIYTYPSVRVSLVWVTSFAWVALLSAVSNKSASVRQKPGSCSATACALPHIPHASQGYLSSFGSGKTVAPVVLGSYHPVTSGAWVEEGNYCPQVLPFMWRAHLPLACRLQGWHRVVCANLAGKD